MSAFGGKADIKRMRCHVRFLTLSGHSHFTIAAVQLDPVNAFAVAGSVMSAHDAAAAQMEEGHGGLYALVWGEPVLPKRSTAV